MNKKKIFSESCVLQFFFLTLACQNYVEETIFKESFCKKLLSNLAELFSNGQWVMDIMPNLHYASGRRSIR